MSSLMKSSTTDADVLDPRCGRAKTTTAANERPKKACWMCIRDSHETCLMEERCVTSSIVARSRGSLRSATGMREGVEDEGSPSVFIYHGALFAWPIARSRKDEQRARTAHDTERTGQSNGLRPHTRSKCTRGRGRAEYH